MKKLLLSTLLLLSGVAHAELTKEEGAFISALQSADASKLSTAIQDLGASYNINHDWAKEKKKDGKTVKTPVTNFELIIEATQNDSDKIATIKVLIQADYTVTTKDLELCFAPEHKAILVALTKMFAVAEDEKLVSEILKTDSLRLSVKKELFANLKEMNKELLQQEYVIETLLCLSTNDETNDEVDAWIHELVNEGATVSDTAKSLIEAKIENPQKTGEQIDNPRVDLLKKDVDIAATSIVNGEAKTVLGISAGFIIALVIWKKYKKEIKAFFGDEEIEEALSKK